MMKIPIEVGIKRILLIASLSKCWVRSNEEVFVGIYSIRRLKKLRIKLISPCQRI